MKSIREAIPVRMVNQLENNVGLDPLNHFVEPHESRRAPTANYIGNHLGAWSKADPFQRIGFNCYLNDSTVVFNGNPLLRFDGYYILMDILEIPNLRQKATEVLKRWFQKTCLGLELQDNPFLPQKRQFWFGFYTVASVIYRWVVVFSIMMFLIKVLEPYGLQAVGRLIAISGLAGMVIQPLWQTVKFFRTPGKASKMKQKNVLTSLGVAALAIAGILFIPLPFHVSCAVEIQPNDAQQVFAMVPGRLVSWHKRPGDVVQAGESIAQLDNIDLQLQLLKNTNEYDMAVSRMQVLRDQQFIDPQAKSQLATQQEIVLSKKALLDGIRDRVMMLDVRSHTAGVILPPPKKPVPKQAEAEEQLPSWSGDPFSQKNQSAFFSESDLLCLVGDPARMEAVLVVDQHDIDLVQEGDEADIKIESARLETFLGKIKKISEMEMTVAPESLGVQAGGRLNTEMDSSGKLRPISTSYQARVPLENVDVPLRTGYRGQAKIYVGWKSLGWRISRFLARTFRLEM